jgi:hypothetical protein
MKNGVYTRMAATTLRGRLLSTRSLMSRHEGRVTWIAFKLAGFNFEFCTFKLYFPFR